ncbi:uncharacterized protein [Procambarus clarkii]|uniref:uncharacterized protein n=1 Tax=Procambarus clarkii TaxID=6728 RepID=UPI00374298F6
MKFSTRKSVSVSSRALVLVWVLVTAVKGQASSQASPPAESGRSGTPPPVVLVHDLDHRPSYTNNPQSPEIREETLRPLNKRVPYLYTAGASQISHVRSQRNVKSIFPSSGSTRLEQPPYNTLKADVGGRHQSEANYYQFSKQHEPAVQRKTLITENENRYKGPQKLSQDRITYSSLAELLRIPVVTLPPSQSVIGSTRAHVPKGRRQMLAPTGIKLTPPLRLLLNNEPSSPLPPSTSRKFSTASPLISEDDEVVHHTNESTKRNKREFMKKVNLLHKYFEIEKLERHNDFRISENGQNNRRNTREIIDDYLESQHGRRRPENTFSNADTTVGLWAVLGSGTSTLSTRDDTLYSTPAMDRGDPIITSAERSNTNNANPPNPIQTDRSPEREMTENGPSLTVNTDHSTRTGSVHHSLTATHTNSHTSTITDEDDHPRKTEDSDKSLNIILDKDAYLHVTDERDHLSKTSGLDGLLDTRKDRVDKLDPTQYEDDTLGATHYEDNTHSSTHYKDDFFGTSHYEDDIRGPTHYEYNFSGEVIDEDDYSGATTERDVFGTTTDRNDLPDTASGDGDYPRTTTDQSGLPGTHTDGDNYTGITADEHFERGRYPTGQDESDVLGMKRNEHEHTIKVEDGDKVEKLCKKIKVLFDFLDTNHTSLDFSDKNFDISKLEYEKHVIMLRKEFERLGLYEEEYKNGDSFLPETTMSKQNEYPLASKVSDYKDWPESGDLQIPAGPSATPPASPDVELWLKDKDGRTVEGKLLPALQYSVSVVAPQSTMLLLSVEGPGGVGVGRLLPDPPHPAHVCHSPPALVSGTAPLVARWWLQPGHLPDRVTFR